MRVILILSILELISCGTQYLIDVNQYHEPLTNYDKVTKSVKYCIHINNNTLDANYLLGTWYEIYKFAVNINTAGSDECRAFNFTIASKEELNLYKAKYDLQNETFTFDDTAVLYSRQNGIGRPPLKGIIVGPKTAKYYFLDPKEAVRLSGMYEVITFKPVNENYMLYYQCSMRGHLKYMWSRKKYQTEAELAKVLQPLYELEHKSKQRTCVKKEVVSTTPYF